MSNASASSVGARDGGSSLFASAIVARVEGTGSHILRIDGYSGTKGIGNGKYISSEPFEAAGHNWRLHYYPDGGPYPKKRDWISLCLFSTGWEKVEAKYTISLLDQDGNPVPSYSQTHTSTFNFEFFDAGEVSRCVQLIHRSDLEKSVYLKDDAFSVRCDVTVFKEKIFSKAIPVSEALPGVVKKER